MSKEQRLAVAVTGINGFVGTHLMQRLLPGVSEIYGFSRQAFISPAYDFATKNKCNIHGIPGDLNELDIKTLGQTYPDAKLGIFYHLAGRAHRPAELSDQVFARQFDADNVQATEKAYHIARMMGARRFVYLSSIKVLGDISSQPFTPQDKLQPGDVYAKSKCDAERLLESLQREYALPVTIVRPPLIYGPGVGGNFQKLLSLASYGLPLPLGGATALRSMLSITNLCDLLINHIPDDDAPYRILHVRDEQDISVRNLLIALADIMGKSCRLVQLPDRLLRFLGAMVGRSTMLARLLDPLQVDDSLTRSLFSWTPPQSTESALKETVDCWIVEH
ncbi:MAG: NAD-dependent epimerase/dehydratase family protein [Pseudomonadales bacterium]|nr:NAD-dependent epimerase/dehydratase family protein [Pseudomonadales bacterium]